MSDVAWKVIAAAVLPVSTAVFGGFELLLKHRTHLQETREAYLAKVLEAPNLEDRTLALRFVAHFEKEESALVWAEAEMARIRDFRANQGDREATKKSMRDTNDPRLKRVLKERLERLGGEGATLQAALAVKETPTGPAPSRSVPKVAMCREPELMGGCFEFSRDIQSFPDGWRVNKDEDGDFSSIAVFEAQWVVFFDGVDDSVTSALCVEGPNRVADLGALRKGMTKTWDKDIEAVRFWNEDPGDCKKKITVESFDEQ